MAFAILTLSVAHAEEAELPDEAPLEIHGFVSQGFVKTTENNYLADSERGSFEFTEVGLNLTKSLSDDLRVGIQLFARDVGPLGNYQPQFDWFYLDYHYADWLGLRAGRTKLPFGLYNETSDIDAARVPVLLPPSLYPTQNREALLAQTGAELYGLVPLGAAGDLEYRLYGGTIYLDTSNASIELRDFHVPYMAGARLHWLPPVQGLTLGASFQALRLDLDYRPTEAENELYAQRGLLPEGYAGTVSLRAPIKLWIASIEYQLKDLVLASEMGATQIDVESSLLNSDQSTLSEGFYVMASYRVRSWFTPGIYYSLLRADVAHRTGRAEHQHDVALTLRYDLQAHWLLKLEGHYMHGTAGLNVQLNDGKSRDILKEDWAVLLVKTTAYF